MDLKPASNLKINPDHTYISMPHKWIATAILHPSDASQIVKAAIEYDWSVKSMHIKLQGLVSGDLEFLVVDTSIYLLAQLNDGQVDSAYCFSPIISMGKVPSPDWLKNQILIYKGTQDILGQSCDWLLKMTTASNGCQNPPTVKVNQLANWVWVREKTGFPHRIFSVDQDNPFELPIIGYFPIICFTSFEADNSLDLSRLVEHYSQHHKILPGHLQLKSSKDIIQSLENISAVYDFLTIKSSLPLIPGLAQTRSNLPLPKWNDRLYLTAFSTPTAEENPYPTEVYYDWTNQRQLSRFYRDDGSLVDCVMYNGKTYVLHKGVESTVNLVKTIPVGLTYPDWMDRCKGRCVAILESGEIFGTDKPIRMIVLPSRHGRVFWVWYTIDDEPLMFAEVPQLSDVELAITDYTGFSPGIVREFEDGLFDIPDQFKSVENDVGYGLPEV